MKRDPDPGSDLDPFTAESMTPEEMHRRKVKFLDRIEGPEHADGESPGGWPSTKGRRGDWFQTYCGIAFFLEDPRPGEVLLSDIAHPLSYQCRYNGHTREFYSVAQHSVLVARCVSEQFGETSVAVLRTALFHDAAEAYLGDLVRPIKRGDDYYRRLEQNLERVIAERFGLLYPFPEVVKRADVALLLAERNVLMQPPPIPWRADETGETPYAGLDETWMPAVAEMMFRRQAREYATPWR